MPLIQQCKSQFTAASLPAVDRKSYLHQRNSNYAKVEEIPAVQQTVGVSPPGVWAPQPFQAPRHEQQQQQVAGLCTRLTLLSCASPSSAAVMWCPMYLAAYLKICVFNTVVHGQLLSGDYTCILTLPIHHPGNTDIFIKHA